ncbi:MAG: hypothetical protein IPI75_10625 [Gammaproteobacteria bacterium]|nr:hypothetical protein [Gammaproteobacteria bacterium]
MDTDKHFSRAPARALRRTALALGIAAAGIGSGAWALDTPPGTRTWR